MDVPLDYPWIRNARVGAAASGMGAARYRFEFNRAAISFEAETAYTAARAAARRAGHSRSTAREADSVLTLARVRRDAGDGSELDVQLAVVSAGQVANAAARDSLDALAAPARRAGAHGIAVERADHNARRTSGSGLPGASLAEPQAGTQLLVAAAEEDLQSADQVLTLERRLLFGRRPR